MWCSYFFVAKHYLDLETVFSHTSWCNGYYCVKIRHFQNTEEGCFSTLQFLSKSDTLIIKIMENNTVDYGNFWYKSHEHNFFVTDYPSLRLLFEKRWKSFGDVWYPRGVWEIVAAKPKWKSHLKDKCLNLKIMLTILPHT